MLRPVRPLLFPALLAAACGDDTGGGTTGEPATAGPATTDVATTDLTTDLTTAPAPTSSTADTGAPTGGDASTGDPARPPGPWDEGWPIPHTPQVPGDPEAGYRALLAEGYVSCGVPWSVWPLIKDMLGDFTRGAPLPGRTGKNAEVPYNWTVHTPASGVEIASLNCLECHAGEFNGELVVGLGVADMDFTDVPMGSLVENLPILDFFPGVLGEISKFAGRYKAVGPHIKMLTVGTNPADMLAVQLAAHRDPATLEWSDEPLLQVPDLMAPVDTPPWWRAHKKHGLFYNGMTRTDHRGTMMFASSLCTDSVEEATEIFAYFNDINAYIESLRPPAYPFAVDAALAAEGAGVFDAACAGCHGTYAADEADETYPNLLFPLHVIGTDATVASAASNDLSYMVDWFNASYYGKILQLVVDDPFPGYVAPPLDGVWATAPFLHNGSVPTIRALLDSSTRPAHWRRVDLDSTNFDADDLGWPFTAVPYGQDAAPDDERKFIYDTTKPGHGNAGHVFGDHLDEHERDAVIEYLKTL
jgi:mono/diheme cytochrome c family protein